MVIKRHRVDRVGGAFIWDLQGAQRQDSMWPGDEGPGDNEEYGNDQDSEDDDDYMPGDDIEPPWHLL